MVELYLLIHQNAKESTCIWYIKNYYGSKHYTRGNLAKSEISIEPPSIFKRCSKRRVGNHTFMPFTQIGGEDFSRNADANIIKIGKT